MEGLCLSFSKIFWDWALVALIATWLSAMKGYDERKKTAEHYLRNGTDIECPHVNACPDRFGR